MAAFPAGEVVDTAPIRQQISSDATQVDSPDDEVLRAYMPDQATPLTVTVA